MSTHAAVHSVAVELLGGAILHGATPDGIVTVGRGRLIDWRTVRSGEDLAVVDESAADFAQLFVALVGAEAAMAALGDEPATPSAFRPPLPKVHVYAPMGDGVRRRHGVTVDGCEVMVTPSWDGDDEEANTKARRLAERIAALELE